MKLICVDGAAPLHSVGSCTIAVKIIFMFGFLLSTCARLVASEQVNPRGWRSELIVDDVLAPRRDVPSATATQMLTSCPTLPTALWTLRDVVLVAMAAFTLGITVDYLLYRMTRPNPLLPSPTQLLPAVSQAAESAAKPLLPVRSEAAPPIKDGEQHVPETAGEAASPPKHPAPPEKSQPAEPEECISTPETRALLSPERLRRISASSPTIICPSGSGADSLGEALELEVAGRLVSSLMASLQVDPTQLSNQDRIQMAQMVLQAWHTQHAQRLGSEAIEVASERRDIAASDAAHRRARTAHELARQHTEDFKRVCADSMATGVAIMVFIGARQAWNYGSLATVGGRCGGLPAAQGGILGLWSAWRALEVVWCYLGGLGDAAVGLAVLMLAPWLLYRTKILSDYHSMPFFKLLLGLGVACGAAGRITVSRLGGDGSLWLAIWELWTVLHVLLSSAAHRVCCRRNMAASAAADDPAALFEIGNNNGWAVSAAMWLLLGLLMPVAMAVLPFVDLGGLRLRL